MKIQELAIIFIIIILPISLLLSEYTQFQIQTIKLQTEYDARLTSATYDAIKAFQLNSTNSTTSDLSNSKMRDLEASIKTFRNSIMTGFELNGYTEYDLNNYIPALVYTLYDGFYIYSPYENTHDESGNRISGDLDAIYGLKPYINYSCRYVKGNIDVVITYALDNYITVQGQIGDVYVNKSGYLIDGITYNEATGKVIYNDIEIKTEHLKEELLGQVCSYAKINGTKYYLLENKIVYILNGTLVVQYEEGDEEYSYWKNKIVNNDSAKQYYKEAYEFTKWFKEETDLDTLMYNDACSEEDATNKLWGGNTTTIFEDSSNNIENESSNFNQHRLAVIRHKIETNLAIAIANYNNYSGASSTNVFQMPELKENEWDNITHNISLISFLQGLHIGGKVYNGYSIVTNSESKEVVNEENIYILAEYPREWVYCKIGDKGIENGTPSLNAYQYYGTTQNGEDTYGYIRSAGRLNLDFERSTLIDNNISYYYYPLKQYNASYDSIVMQNNVTTYDDIYEYVNGQSDELKEAFYTALGRERVSKYNRNTIIEDSTNQGPYIPGGYMQVAGTDLETGFVVSDRSGNEYVWIEVPKTTQVYSTAGLNITSFTDAEYEKIENDLHTYTATYRDGTSYVDEWYSDDTTGLTKEQYYTQKKKMLKSIYINGGFYIGRYETGTESMTTLTPVIKANAYPYNYITCVYAQTYSSRFASSGYISSLMFGVQYDLVLKYLETKGTTQDELMVDSTEWGNYRNNAWNVTSTSAKYSINGFNWIDGAYGAKVVNRSVLLSTGASRIFSKQNISDLAANLAEFTLEYTSNSSYPCAVRGGAYSRDGNATAAGIRTQIGNRNTNANIGFRVTLYKDEGTN